MAVTYAYTDTTGRKLTQSAYDAQAKAGADVSKYTKIDTSKSLPSQDTMPLNPTIDTKKDLPKPAPTTPVVDMSKIKELPQYQELLGKGYTEEQISQAVSQYKPKKTTETAVVPTEEVKTETQTTTVEPNTTTTAKPEEIEATTAGKDQQVLAPLALSEYQDDSEARQGKIVNNLNAYRQSSPSYMKDLDTFRKTFSYGLRSDTQKSLLDNWYLGYQKGLELNGKNSSDLASLYANGNISNSDLEQLRLQNPNKYAEVMALNDKKSTLSKYDAELNGTTESTNPFQSIINNYASNMLSMSTAPSNMFEEYKNAMNSDEMKSMQTQLTDKEGEINQLDLQINQLKSDVERRYEGTGATRSKINAIIADETSALQELRNAKAIDYQTLAKKYENQMTSITDSFDMQIKEQEYNNSQRNQQMQELGFMMELQNYETNEQKDERERQKYIRQQEYQDGNIYSSDPATRRKAVEKAVDRVLTEFEGIPMVRSREQMVSDIQNMVDSGTELGEAITKNIRNPIMNKPEYTLWKKNKLGISTTPISIGDNYYIQNADGSLSLWKGYNTQGNVNGVKYTAVNPTTVQAAVQQISAQGDGSIGGQCGSFVNDYLQDIGLSRMFKDPITQKESLVNTQTPSIGSVIITDSPTAKEYGHVGIITSVNGNQVTIKQSNGGGTLANKVYTTTGTINGNGTITIKNPSGSSYNTGLYGFFDPTLGGSSSVSGGATPTAAELLYFKDGKIKKKATDEGLTEQRYNEIAKIQQSNGKGAIIGGIDTTTAFSLLSFPTAVKSEQEQKNIQDLVAAGNISAVKSKLINLAVNNIEGAESKKDYQSTYTMIGNLDKIQTLLDRAEELGVPTGRLSGKSEDLVNKFGRSNNPEIVRLGTALKDQLDALRRGRSGAALTEFEEKFYDSIFPSSGKKYNLNTANINGLKDSRNMLFKTYLENAYTSEIAEQIIGTSQSDTTTKNTGTTKNYFTTYKTVTPTKTTSTSYSSSPYFNYISGY